MKPGSRRHQPARQRAQVERRDGLVEVELHDGVLTVRDHGPGFHEEDLPFVFDRFHRARDARSKAEDPDWAGDRA